MADDIQKKYLKILLIKSTYKTLLGRPADPEVLKIITMQFLTSRLQNQHNVLTHR